MNKDITELLFQARGARENFASLRIICDRAWLLNSFMARSKTRLLHPAGGCLSQTLPSTLISLIMVIWCKMRTMTNTQQACRNIPLEIIIFMSNAACRLCTEPFLVPLKYICQLQDNLLSDHLIKISIFIGNISFSKAKEFMDHTWGVKKVHLLCILEWCSPP